MNTVWQVQEAKNRLSEVLHRASTEGPQVITRHGRPIAKVVSLEEPAAAASPNDAALLDLLLNAPKSGLPEGLPAFPRSVDTREPLFGEGD